MIPLPSPQVLRGLRRMLGQVEAGSHVLTTAVIEDESRVRRLQFVKLGGWEGQKRGKVRRAPDSVCGDVCSCYCCGGWRVCRRY
jgi:hypothetical protein